MKLVRLTESGKRRKINFQKVGKMKIVFLACLVWLPFINCGIIDTCKLDVLSNSDTGLFFNFNRSQIRGFKEGEVYIFEAMNPRTGKTGVVKIWGEKLGGKKGDAHGRFNVKQPGAKAGDWLAGDLVIIKDKSICKQVSCIPKVDMGFLLDSSASILNNYQDEKKFIQSVAGIFGISKDGSHASVITFSVHAKLSIKLNSYTNIEDFNQAVNKIPLINSLTRIDEALTLAETEMFSRSNGGRTGVTKILVLLTDGKQSNVTGHEDPAVIAARIRKAGINLIVVGMGKGVSSSELSRIAGGSGDYFIANTFYELMSNEFTGFVTTRMCEA